MSPTPIRLEFPRGSPDSLELPPRAPGLARPGGWLRERPLRLTAASASNLFFTDVAFCVFRPRRCGSLLTAVSVFGTRVFGPGRCGATSAI